MPVNVRQPTDHDGLSPRELALYHLIMDYRAAAGLDPIPLSRALTATAGRHVLDTRENIWPSDRDHADLHDWSDARFHGSDGRPEAMWDAPARLGTGYAGSGYEISAAGQPDVAAALAGWQGSPGHDAVITNSGGWSRLEFNAIGIGVETAPGAGSYGGRIYHVWFGEAADESPTIRGTGAAETIRGTAFADVIRARAGDDRGQGGGGADRIFGGSGADRLSGQSGADRLHGDDGGDRLKGGSGGDRLFGRKGHDRLEGGAGADILAGGAGRDRFVFGTDAAGAVDTIRDFRTGTDLVDLRPLAAEVGGLRFLGTGAFRGRDGDLRVAEGRVRIDLDGDRDTDLGIDLDGGILLGAGDFLI